MTNRTNEDRAYALAALDDDGFELDGKRYKLGVAAAIGRYFGLHDQAKAILEEMAGPVPAMDLYGRVLAPEGYVLVPRDVAEKAVLYQLALHSWMDEGSEGMAVSPSEVLANYVALADALKKEG